MDITTGDHWAALRLSGGASWSAIRAQLESLAPGDTARVVLIDIDGGASLDGWDPEATRWLSHEYTTPVVVALSGSVAGDMANLALAADIRIAADSLCFDLTSIQDGPSRARAATLLPALSITGATAPTFTAAEALEVGLVSRLVPQSRLAAAARDIVEAIAARGPIATKLGKEAVWRGLEMPLEQALRFETDLTLLLQTTKDRAEGVAAFAEKRNPHFTGE